MERLPNEVWQQICYHSNIQTLKTLRIVHPIFNDLAARVLFRTVYVAVFYLSFRNMYQIASHPVLCLYVHKIMFQRQVLDDRCCNYQTWLETIDLRALSDPRVKICNETRKVWADAHYFFPDIPLPEEFIASVDLGSCQIIRVSEKSLMSSHSRFKRLCLQQHYLFPSNEIDAKEVDPNAEHGTTPKPRYVRAVDYLSYAVTKLINLCTVETFEEPQEVKCTTHRAAGDPEGAAPSFFSRLKRETLLKFPFHDSNFSDYICNPIVASEPIIVLLKALCPLVRRTSSRLGKPKFNLVIDALPWSFWIHGFGSLWARDSKTVLIILSRLRSLDIHFCIGRPHAPAKLSPVTTQMTEFMNGLKEVEQLKVKFKDPKFGRHFTSELPQYTLPDVSKIFQQISLQRLSDLSIGDCSFHEEVLVTFMQRHSKQLKRFNGIRLTLIGAWGSALQRIAPVMSLDVVNLQYLLDDEIMNVKHVDAFRVLVEYDKMATLYLKLNGHTQYPSLSALASKTALNPGNEAVRSHAPDF